MPLLLLLACRVQVDGDTAQPPPWSEPEAVGPYAVGVSTHRFTDARGKRLTVELWYPAEVEDGAAPDPYEELPWTLSAHRDVPPDARGAPYPLVAFSHGNGGIRYQSAYLMEHLASHGYVLAAVDHEGNTLLDMDDSAMLQIVLERPGDVMGMVDEVYALHEAGEAPLAGMVDPDAGYIMMGHSFGAWTSLIVGGGQEDLSGLATYCEGRGGIACRFLSMVEVDDPDDPRYALPSDPRVIATVPLSPGVWYGFVDDGAGLASVVKPLLFAGDRDDVLGYEDEVLPVYASLSRPKRLATLVNGGHYAFTDICRVASAFFDDCAGEAEGWIDLDEAHRLSRAVITAWLGREVKADADYAPWLDGDWAQANPSLRMAAEE